MNRKILVREQIIKIFKWMDESLLSILSNLLDNGKLFKLILFN